MGENEIERATTSDRRDWRSVAQVRYFMRRLKLATIIRREEGKALVFSESIFIIFNRDLFLILNLVVCFFLIQLLWDKYTFLRFIVNLITWSNCPAAKRIFISQKRIFRNITHTFYLRHKQFGIPTWSNIFHNYRQNPEKRRPEQGLNPLNVCTKLFLALQYLFCV